MQQVAYKYADSWQEKVELPVIEPRIRKVVKTKSNQHRKIMVKAGLFMFGYAVLLVFLCAKSASLGYDIEGLNRDVSKLTTANHRLEYQIASYSSLSRIEKIAVSELGMQRAELQNSIAVKVEPKPVQVAVREQETTNLSERSLYKIYTSLSHLAQNSR
ncbi:MAG TPA: cell division protein FtsL [Syntrophomonas sp.]|jgi:cell division protein FtsL|nr:cell division protein FtsL [Syntrophomonas sp.]HRW12885.1 cell division protein FtsL [Syntrophomonas sp.]